MATEGDATICLLIHIHVYTLVVSITLIENWNII